MDAIIFDIDGTLADVSHRLHHLPNWGKFFDAMVDDQPKHDVVKLAEMLALYSEEYYGLDELKFFICSGRPETHREQTETWLCHEVFELWIATGSENLLMRPEDDFRPDTVIKRQMLNYIRGQGHNVRFVVDDRQSVVDMWREEGITCFQCAPGDFDKPKYESGELKLMVGPSGAGKTTYIESMIMDGCMKLEQVVSSDEMRDTLCDDFRDQSRNSQMWDGLHAIVKARLEHGLATVVDATNLKNRDRKAFLDLTPSDCRIEYVVVDRPMGEKIRDAGWRTQVSVKGKSLIDYHHDVFQSNLSMILAGDNDPRVIVSDVRRGV